MTTNSPTDHPLAAGMQAEAKTKAPADRSNASSIDWALVQQTLAGENKAFELLVIKYQKRIERLIAHIVRDANLVPDLTQETFIAAYRALGQFRGDAQFYTWLHHIAANLSYKALHERKRNPITLASDLSAAHDDSQETFSNQPELSVEETPESALASRQIAKAIEEAIYALPEDLRQAWTLREMDGLNYEAIAQTMQTPIGTVRSRIFRAREAIAAKIGPLLEHRSGKRW